MDFIGDIHIHSCLSPCGDKEMIPPNVINMAKLMELDFIAVTDHNSCKNARSFIDEGRESGILVFPGIEVQTIEEVHILTLFQDIVQCEELENIIQRTMMKVKNNENAFGEQIIIDQKGNPIGKEEQMLAMSCGLSVYEVVNITEEIGGIAIPAHIDRPFFSLISNLGFLPPDLGIKTVEISRNSKEEILSGKYPFLKGIRMVRSSDAHFLKDMVVKPQVYPMEMLSFSFLKSLLKSEIGWRVQ